MDRFYMKFFLKASKGGTQKKKNNSNNNKEANNTPTQEGKSTSCCCPNKVSENNECLLQLNLLTEPLYNVLKR